MPDCALDVSIDVIEFVQSYIISLHKCKMTWLDFMKNQQLCLTEM